LQPYKLGKYRGNAGNNTWLAFPIKYSKAVVVSVLATGPKGCGFEPGQGDGFLRTIKIRSTPSFGWEVKPEVPCSKIYCI
jgi:hypothetical protein